MTGLGAVTPIGIGTEAFWEALLGGRGGVGPVTRFDASRHTTRIAAEVKGFDPLVYVSRKDARHLDRFCQFAIAAAAMAVEDARLAGAYPPGEVAVVVGSGIGGCETIEREAAVLAAKGPGRISPYLIPMAITNMAAGVVSMRFGFKGPTTNPVTACATGAHAIGDAYRLIRRGAARAAVAGGTEACLTPLFFGGFCSAKAMSTRNHDPATASRPFDKGRDGFVMGEGAGLVVLEDLEAARARGARVYAEIVGYGMTGDAYHMTAPAPAGEGIARAMEAAIAESGIPKEGYHYVNAHGTSTPLNDKNETAAIKTVFGDGARHLPVSSTKSMTGHLIGAAGGIETIVCAKVIETGRIPPTINQIERDPECDLDYVPNIARTARVRAALNLNLGFGGQNAVLAIAQVRS